MTDQHPPQSFLDKLQSTVAIRPKWRFWLDHLAVGAAIVLVAVGLVYIASFVTFLWRSAKFSALPALGPDGYRVFARIFPWWHLVFIVLGIIAFIYLLRRHTKLYRWPLAMTLGVFLFAFVTAAFVTDTTRVHDRLTNRQIDGMPVPFVGRLYRGQAGIAQGVVTAATITKIGEQDLTVTVGQKKVKVTISEATRLPADWDPKVGDEIVVLGKQDDGKISAVAIHDADELPDRQPFRVYHENLPPPPDLY